MAPRKNTSKVSSPVSEAQETEKPTDGRKPYLVTEKAGPRVAGKRVKSGEKIILTADEARSELVFGTIEDPEKPKE